MAMNEWKCVGLRNYGEWSEQGYARVDFVKAQNFAHACAWFHVRRLANRPTTNVLSLNIHSITLVRLEVSASLA